MFWKLIFENYQGADFFYYFDNESAARTTYESIREAYKDYEEFEDDVADTISWYDPAYNEYSTYVYIEPSPSTAIFSEPIPVKDI